MLPATRATRKTALDWRPFVLLIGSVAIATVGESQTPNVVEDVTRFGQQLENALRAGTVTSLEVRGTAQKNNPSRVVEVRQYHLTAEEVRAMLLPVADVLARQNFTILETHNLATLHVTFLLEVRSICPAAGQRFTIVSTAVNAFYVGCTGLDERPDSTARLVRISSASLYDVLQKHFPSELRPAGNR
jgi:hypothetical protein